MCERFTRADARKYESTSFQSRSSSPWRTSAFFFWQRIVYRCRRCERGSPSSCPPAASWLSSGRRSPSSTSCRASAAWRRRSQWISARVSSRRREHEKVEAQQSVPQRQGTWPQLHPLSAGEARWAPMRLCRRALPRLHRWRALVELVQLEPKLLRNNDDDALNCAVAHAHAHAHDVDSCSLYCHVVIIVVVRSRLSWSCVLSVLLVVPKWLGVLRAHLSASIEGSDTSTQKLTLCVRIELWCLFWLHCSVIFITVKRLDCLHWLAYAGGLGHFLDVFTSRDNVFNLFGLFYVEIWVQKLTIVCSWRIAVSAISFDACFTFSCLYPNA